jgi:hypothetical protein
MMATRNTSKSALLKSKIDQLDYRLKELESHAADMRKSIAELQDQLEEAEAPFVPSIFPAPPARKSVVQRPPQKIKFTTEVFAMIPLWLEEGLTRHQIADKIGCTTNSLQATCSKRGISLKNREVAQ